MKYKAGQVLAVLALLSLVNCSLEPQDKAVRISGGARTEPLLAAGPQVDDYIHYAAAQLSEIKRIMDIAHLPEGLNSQWGSKTCSMLVDDSRRGSNREISLISDGCRNKYETVSRTLSSAEDFKLTYGDDGHTPSTIEYQILNGSQKLKTNDHHVFEGEALINANTTFTAKLTAWGSEEMERVYGGKVFVYKVRYLVTSNRIENAYKDAKNTLEDVPGSTSQTDDVKALAIVIQPEEGSPFVAGLTNVNYDLVLNFDERKVTKRRRGRTYPHKSVERAVELNFSSENLLVFENDKDVADSCTVPTGNYVVALEQSKPKVKINNRSKLQLSANSWTYQEPQRGKPEVSGALNCQVNQKAQHESSWTYNAGIYLK